MLKKYTEQQDKIKNLIKSTTITFCDYYKKYMKIKFDSDDDLPLSKILNASWFNKSC